MENGETFTCGQAEGFLALSNPFGSCDFVWYLGVSLCGCEYTLTNATCPLCEDGSALPNPSFEIIPDVTCNVLEYSISSFDEIECVAAIQAVAGVYCGCDNPVVSQNACRICGDSLLPDASWIADPENQTTCLELELQANGGEITCTEVQDTWAPICCSTEIPLVKPPSAPTSTPAAPTVAPSGTSDAAHVSIKLASVFVAGAALLLVV
jgi:hypothetical protein